MSDTWSQFNDQHSKLALGYGSFSSTDEGAIAQGDNFVARVVPLIMASRAYQEGAANLLWWDETEGGAAAVILAGRQHGERVSGRRCLSKGV